MLAIFDRLKLAFMSLIACLFVLLPGTAFADDSLPIFPEWQPNYVIVQNQVFPDEYYLFLSSGSIQANGFDLDNPDQGSYISTSIGGGDGRAASYVFDRSSSRGWVLVDEQEYSGSNLIPYSFAVKSNYWEDLRSLYPDLVVSGSGKCITDYLVFSNPLFGSGDLVFSGSGDLEVYLPWVEQSEDKFQYLLNHFSAYWRNWWVFITANFVPLSIACIGVFAGLFVILKLAKSSGLFNSSPGRSRGSRRRYKASPMRVSRGRRW